jgi:hypothetical protein
LIYISDAALDFGQNPVFLDKKYHKVMSNYQIVDFFEVVLSNIASHDMQVSFSMLGI